MKYALITPPHGAWLLQHFDLGYHFVLPQYVGDPAYRRVYQRRASLSHFIMMDNGAAENGESYPAEWLATLANTVHADEVVMPDVLGDREATLNRTREALKFFPPRMRAFCPQGQSWTDWLDCANHMTIMGGATLCIAKRYERLPGGRAHGLHVIRELGWDKKFHIHLLGFDKNPIVEIRAARLACPTVRGVDSAAPIAYAQQGKTIDCGEHASIDWEKDFDGVAARTNTMAILEACDAHHITE